MAFISKTPGKDYKDYQDQREEEERDTPNDEEREEPVPAFWSVSVHLVDRCYGGPEEGGWYYDAGVPLSTFDDLITDERVEDMKLLMDDLLPKAFEAEADAHSYALELQAKLDATANKGRRCIGSVLSQGVYRAEVQAGYPHSWPVGTPHYE